MKTLKKILSPFKRKKRLIDYVLQASKETGVQIDSSFYWEVDGIMVPPTPHELKRIMYEDSHVRFRKRFDDGNGMIVSHMWQNFDPREKAN
jgi:hypothetical protein